MRNKEVSISKAIAIILMVLAHASIPVWGQRYINMFHMPLFFFFAGYCFKEKYLNKAWSFIKKKIKGIYCPFVKYGLFFLLLHNMFFYLNIYNGEYGFRGSVSEFYSIKEYAIHAVNIITRMSDQEQLLGGYWFLKTLFWASLIGYFLILQKSKFYIFKVGILLFISALCVVWNIQVPFWGIGAREFLAAFFFVFGYCYYVSKLKIEHIKLVIPIGLVLIGIGVEYWSCNMLNLTVKKIIPYSLTAIIGILSIFSLSRWLSFYNNYLKRYLIYIGDNTLPILTWHFLCFKLVSLLIISINNLPIQRLAEFPVIEEYAFKGWWIAYSFVGIVIPLLIFELIRYFKVIINEKIKSNRI